MTLVPVPVGSIAAVVTHLEMTERPRMPPQPKPGLSLEHVLQPDLEWYRGIYRAIGEDWLWFSRLVMTDEQVQAILRKPQVAVYALREGGDDIGLVELDWREAPDCEISFFGLIPTAIGQGHGAWAMRETQRLAFEAGAARLWLPPGTSLHPTGTRR